ncbi:hypothetical protein SAMN05444285_10720 [Draconibacterium orientale]|nr:hypothetical protein SAMN05444285_10720 [Draconibacterium orientale]
MPSYQPEMQKTSEKCDCTSRKCEKPTRNVKNRREMRHDAVDSKSGTFLPFLSGKFHFWDRFPKEYREIAEKEACEAFLQGKERAFRVFLKF